MESRNNSEVISINLETVTVWANKKEYYTSTKASALGESLISDGWVIQGFCKKLLDKYPEKQLALVEVYRGTTPCFIARKTLEQWATGKGLTSGNPQPASLANSSVHS